MENRIPVRHECKGWGKIWPHHRIARQKLPISSHGNLSRIFRPQWARLKLVLSHIAELFHYPKNTNMCISQHWQEIRVKSACELIDSFWCSIRWWVRIWPKVTYSCRGGTPFGISTDELSVGHDYMTWGKILLHRWIVRQKLPTGLHADLSRILHHCWARFNNAFSGFCCICNNCILCLTQ
jgi:hypothetical protein